MPIVCPGSPIYFFMQNAYFFNEVLYYSTRIKCTFNKSDSLDLFSNYNSGVWFISPEYLSRGGRSLFYATNRHVFDISYNPEFQRQNAHQLINVSLEFRKVSNGQSTGETKFVEFPKLVTNYYVPADNSDLVIYKIDTTQEPLRTLIAENWKVLCINYDVNIAHSEYFNNELKPVDSVTFVGFPKGDFDLLNNLPIARNANIASAPHLRFKNEAVEGDLILVAGMSFGGSSGSPVYSLPVGNPGLGFGRVLIPKLIGIMSGHLNGERGHKGLSYFVKSTKISDTIKEHNLLKI